MIPLGDDNASVKTVPIVTYILIAINIIFFLLELSLGEEFIMRWAFVPSRFLQNPAGEFPTLFTSIFMHAGWGHLIGNMLYLWIFGDNVEDNFGKWKYLFFYLLCGLAATFSQMFFQQGADMPNLGASGAIAGVLGAYIFMFPRGRVKVAIGANITAVPAIIAIGFWFFMQFLSGLGSLSATSEEGGVAYMAHIGGFVAGLAMTFLFRNRAN